MNAVLKGSCLVGMGMFVVLSRRPARAAEGPLLVVVEAPPALDADAAEIRRAIGTELRSQTIAPMKRGGEPPERALIVAFDRDRIAMSLRTNDGAPVVRDIPAPADPTARLRAIAWLAGNLARDQVTSIVAEAPAETTPLATIPSIAPAPATEPPPLPSPTAIPTAVVPTASVTPTAAETVATTGKIAPPENLTGPDHWSITFADGPTDNIARYNRRGEFGTGSIFGTAWYLDVQRRSEKNGFLLGAALSGTNGDFAPRGDWAVGIRGLSEPTRPMELRDHRRCGRGTGGRVCALYDPDAVTTALSRSQLTQQNQVRPALLADAGVAVAHSLWQSVDAVVRLGAHLSTISLDDFFLATTIGLRYNLQ